VKRRRLPPGVRQLARALRPSRRAEEAYAQALRGVLRGIGRALAKSAEEVARARADSARADAKLRPVGGMLAKAQQATQHAFDLMAGQVEKGGTKALSGLGVSLSPKLGPLAAKRMVAAAKAARKENVSLIKTAAQTLHQQISQVLEETQGKRWEEIAPLIAERVSVGEYNAERIARDQTLTLNADLIRVQQEEAGITGYIWSTSQDERVREEHADREGVEFSWDDPPEDGHPGEPILCRCVAIPLLPSS